MGIRQNPNPGGLRRVRVGIRQLALSPRSLGASRDSDDEDLEDGERVHPQTGRGWRIPSGKGWWETEGCGKAAPRAARARWIGRALAGSWHLAPGKQAHRQTRVADQAASVQGHIHIHKREECQI